MQLVRLFRNPIHWALTLALALSAAAFHAQTVTGPKSGVVSTPGGYVVGDAVTTVFSTMTHRRPE